MTVEEWLGADNKLGQDIWHKKYQRNNETFDDWVTRVSNGNEEIEELIRQKKFLAGGRVLSNIGIDNDGSLFNCFTAGTKVITKRGYLNIEDVVIGDEVIGEDDKWHTVNDVMARHYQGDLYKISSNWFTDDIVCTPNHKFLTQNGWKRADRLEAHPMRVTSPDRLKIPDLVFPKSYEKIDLTDYLVLSDNQRYEIDEQGKVQITTLFQSANKYGKYDKTVECRNQKAFNRYLVLDEDMRYFIGRWLGDGSVTMKNGKESSKTNASVLQIVFNAQKEKDAAERIIKIGTTHFGFEPSVRETNQNVIAVRWSGETICNFFSKEFGQYCDGKFVPEKYEGDLQIVLGLIDSDGFIDTHGGIRLVLKNKELIDFAQRTLTLNGMPSGKIVADKKYEGTYHLEISTGIGKGKIGKLLMRTYHDKKCGLDDLSAYYKDYAPIKNISIIENADTDVYNLSVEDVHSYTANGVVVHNCYSYGYVDDDYKSILQAAMDIGLTFKAQGGQGLSLSKLRPKNAPIGEEYTSDGIIPFMKIFNEVTAGTSQGGSRKGALMMSLDAWHKEALDFIKIKSQEGAIEKANLSLEIDDEFMKAIEDYYANGEEKEIEITKDYSGHKVTYTVKPIEVFKALVDNCYDWGDPACLFTNRFRNYNMMEFCDDYQIENCNPCGKTLAAVKFRKIGEA